MTRLIVLLALSFSTVFSVVGSEKAKPSKRDQELIVHQAEQRAFRDVSGPLLLKPDVGWAAIRIIPEVQGGITYAESAIDSLKDDFDTSEPLEEQKLFKGKWQRLSKLTSAPGRAETVGDFHWLEPLIRKGGFQPATDAEELVDFPFNYGGTVLCRFDAAAKDKKPFSDVCLLPNDENWSKAAIAVVEHPELVLDIEKSIRTGQVDKLAVEKNPLLGVYGFRRLLESEHLDEIKQAAAFSEIWNKCDLARPVIAFLLTRPQPKTEEISQKVLADLIEGAATGDELESLCRGFEVSQRIAKDEYHKKQKNALHNNLTSIRKRAVDLNDARLIESIDILLK